MIPYDEQTLEYNGPYGCRYLCSDCRYFASESKTCAMLANPSIKVSGKNNICRLFDPRIKNPSAPPFNFDDYLEFLGSDYYRPLKSTTDFTVNLLFTVTVRFITLRSDGGKRKRREGATRVQRNRDDRMN